MKEKSNKVINNICIITTPRPKAGVTPLSNYINIMTQLSNNVCLITGNEGYNVLNKYDIKGRSIVYNTKKNIFFKIFNYIHLQLKISHIALKCSKDYDTYIFFMGEGLFIPTITLKLLRKKVVLSLAGSFPKMNDSKKNLPLLFKITKYFELINYSVSDKMIVYSPSIISEWNLEKYNYKILIAHEHFLDFNNFKINKQLKNRDMIIGFIGRLSEEKGIKNFMIAIPELLKLKPNLKFYIGGSGDLQKYVENYIIDNNLTEHIKLLGWINHNELPKYLNQLKLIALPSYTEGLPNIMLEAMACGTPVVTTPVGAIQDIIKDEKTGFIMESNSPECIVNNIIRALEHPSLNEIITNAEKKMKNDFDYDSTVNKYKEVVEML